MSRRREAAELAHALALSTQQARDISDISPHSLSSENADRTQDSKELELRIVGMEQPTGTASDEVAFFSSRNVDGDMTHDDTIQSFTASRQDASAIPLSSDPFVVGPQHAGYSILASNQPFSPAPVLQPATGQTPASSSSRPKLSPIQTSDAQPRPVVTYQRKRDTERTPLRNKDTNKEFRLSSSPPQADDQKLPDNPSSEPEIIEVIETDRVRGESRSASSRGRLLPEIVLSSKKGSSARQESPDPLDSFTGYDRPHAIDGSGRQFATSSIPSTAGPSNSPLNEQEDSGRRSGRVKAATEKKEAEKEERRRLRRERKAREEEEKKRMESVGGRSDQAQSSRRTTPRKREHMAEDDNEPMEAAEPDSLTTATPTTAASKKKTPVSKRAKPSAKKRSRKATADDHPIDAPVSDTRQPPSIDANEVVAVAEPGPADAETQHQEKDEESTTKPSHVAADTAPVDIAEDEPTEVPANPTAPNADGPSAIPHGGSTKSRSETPSIRARTPLSPPPRHSPGPQGPSGSASRPGGIRWQTSRSDLNSVLSKFPGSRPTGMSKRHRIAPLHAKIGPPVKALPPAPLKPIRKKKDDEDEDEDEEQDGDGDSEDEESRAKKAKAKAMEWYMVED